MKRSILGRILCFFWLHDDCQFGVAHQFDVGRTVYKYSCRRCGRVRLRTVQRR